LKFTYGGFTWDEVGTLRLAPGTATATATFTLGATATATATVAGGAVTAIAVTAGGSGYAAVPAVTIAGDGAGATATATLTGNAVTAITVTAGGAGYTAATVTIAAPTTGTVTALTLTSGGSGYWTAPAVTIAAPAAGTTATATATVAGGAVTGFVMTNNGSGYTAAPAVTIAAPAFTGLGNFNVVGVLFSPSHLTDAEIICAYVTGGNTYLSSKFGTLDWNQFIAASPAMAGAATKAVIAVGTDYVANTGSPILVGTTVDLYRIAARAAAGGTVTDLTGATAVLPIRQIAVSGPAASATILYSTLVQLC